MKTNRNVLKAVAAAVLACSAGFASAGTATQAVNVSATVSGVCKFTTGAAISLTFAAIDPSTTGNKTQTASLPFQCNTGMTTATAAVTTGGTTLTSGANTMAYALTLGAVPTGAGFAAAATNIVATGTIAQTAYQPAAAGTYTDAAVVTLTF
ncbi:MAG: hypothetical protein H0X13_13830 [Ramlibacter sp.]|nr:hypothetical protein [Ramlibacter sp.]